MALSTDDTNQNPFSGFFWANNPNVNQQLRQRIAAQLIGQGKSKGYPKNLGEGLTAIGDSIGDLGMARRLEQGDLAQQAAAQRDAASLMGGDQQSTSSTPSGDRSDAVVAPDPTIAPATAQQPLAAPLTAAETAAGTVDPSAKNPLDTTADTDPWAARSRAIAGIESGGAKDPYATVGAATKTGDRAYGKYQMMGANVPEWTRAATGTAMTPEQFLASKAAQEATFRHRFGQYADKYGDQGAAQAWFGGEGGMKNPNATDVHGRLTVGSYGQDYLRRLAAADGTPAAAGGAAQPAAANPPVAAALLGGASAAFPAGAQPAPNPNQIQQTRDLIAAKIQARGGALVPPGAPQPGPVGGPLPNPTLAGASAPLPATLTPPPSPSPQGPGGPPPDQRLAGIQALPPAPSGLRAMPPPASPQQLAQNGAVPGYVMPDPQAPQAPPFVPLSPLGQRALAILNANPNNEYYAKGAIGQTLNNEIAKQKQQQDQANEAYKKQVETQAAMQLKRQEQLADQAKRIADYQKTQSDIQQGQVPTTRKLNGQDVQYDPATGQWLPPPRGAVDPNAPPTAELTEPQQKAMLYYTGGRLAHEALQGKEQLIAQGLKEEALGHVPFGSNAMLSSQYRQAKTASDQFVQYFIHSLSGAAFSKAEQEQKIKNMMPSYGDDPGTLALKAQQRESFIRSEYAALGPGGQQAADWNIKQHKDNAATKQSTIDQEMSGVTPKGVGDIKTNKKTGAKRLWTGQNWVEM